MPPDVFCLFERNRQNKEPLLLALLDTGGTVMIAANIKSFTANNPWPNFSNIATSTLNIKPDPDQGDCDLSIKPAPIKICRTSNSATVDNSSAKARLNYIHYI